MAQVKLQVQTPWGIIGHGARSVNTDAPKHVYDYTHAYTDAGDVHKLMRTSRLGPELMSKHTSEHMPVHMPMHTAIGRLAGGAKQTSAVADNHTDVPQLPTEPRM